MTKYNLIIFYFFIYILTSLWLCKIMVFSFEFFFCNTFPLNYIVIVYRKIVIYFFERIIVIIYRKIVMINNMFLPKVTVQVTSNKLVSYANPSLFLVHIDLNYQFFFEKIYQYFTVTLFTSFLALNLCAFHLSKKKKLVCLSCSHIPLFVNCSHVSLKLNVFSIILCR